MIGQVDPKIVPVKQLDFATWHAQIDLQKILRQADFAGPCLLARAFELSFQFDFAALESA